MSTFMRRLATLSMAAGLLAVATVVPAEGVAAETAPPTGVTSGGDLLADPEVPLDLTGDFIVRPDEGPAVHMPEPDSFLGRAAGGLLSTNPDGFRSWNGTSGNRGTYGIRLVASPGIEGLRPLAQTVAAELTSITGYVVTVLPGTIAGPIGDPADGEIRVVVSDDTPCFGQIIGCGEVQTTGGAGQRGRVWITSAGMLENPARRTSLLRHEIGHALGLEHYQPLFNGQKQVMASGLEEAVSYGTGDRNGLRFLSPTCGSRPGDVPAANPFCDEIAWTVGKGIFNGYGDGTFRPGAPVSRQAMAAMLYRWAGSPAVSGGTGFPDVPPGHVFADAIRWLRDRGITQGYRDGTFRPTAPVSRQAMASFLYEYLDWRNTALPSGGYGNVFPDVPAAHQFHEPISWLAGHLVVQGQHRWTGETWVPYFDTTSPVSRQAVAAFVFRAENL